MQSPVADQLLAFGTGSACSATGLSRRRLRSWESDEVVAPSIVRKVGNRFVRLYEFNDMLELLVAKELRSRFSMQQIRKLLIHLREQERLERPLIDVEFAIDDSKNIVFRRADGSWSDDSQPNQYLLSQVLMLEPLRERIRDWAQRAPESSGAIAHDRGVQGSAARFDGTRTPLSAIKPYLSRGYSDSEIIDEFPSLTVRDLELARDHFASQLVAG